MKLKEGSKMAVVSIKLTESTAKDTPGEFNDNAKLHFDFKGQERVAKKLYEVICETLNCGIRA